MELRLYDTLTKEKRPFAPLDPTNVRMYVCGPTVYDFAHIGNARRPSCSTCCSGCCGIVYGADHVTYVRNITDVDDKINERAARDFPGLPLNEAIRKVTEQTDKQFQDDVDRARLPAADASQPRATEHIAEMRAIIEKTGRRRLRLCRARTTCCFAAGDERGRYPVDAATTARCRSARSTR